MNIQPGASTAVVGNPDSEDEDTRLSRLVFSARVPIIISLTTDSDLAGATQATPTSLHVRCVTKLLNALCHVPCAMYGGIECCFACLAKSNLQLMALRCAYLPLYDPAVRSHFNLSSATQPTETTAGIDVRNNSKNVSTSVPDPIAQSQQLWYSCNSVPLKWHLPIGLLYDLFRTSSSPTFSSSAPWYITLHTTAFPHDKLFRSSSLDPLVDLPRDFFMNSVKESDYIRNMSTKKVMALSKSDQNLLWDSIFNAVNATTKNLYHNQQTDEIAKSEQEKLNQLHDQFWAVNSKLFTNQETINNQAGAGAASIAADAVASGSPNIPPSSLISASPGNNPDPSVGSPSGSSNTNVSSSNSNSRSNRAIAVRIYTAIDKPYIQELIAPKDANGREITVVEMLRQVVPEIFAGSGQDDLDSFQQHGSICVVIHGVQKKLNMSEIHRDDSATINSMSSTSNPNSNRNSNANSYFNGVSSNSSSNGGQADRLAHQRLFEWEDEEPPLPPLPPGTAPSDPVATDNTNYGSNNAEDTNNDWAAILTRLKPWPKVQKRMFHIDETIANQASFVSDLANLYEYYYEPLCNTADDAVDIVPAAQRWDFVFEVFGPLTDLLEANRRLLQLLLDRQGLFVADVIDLRLEGDTLM
ncbi:autophagy protein 5, partial [Physocladia obscura]